MPQGGAALATRVLGMRPDTFATEAREILNEYNRQSGRVKSYPLSRITVRSGGDEDVSDVVYC